MNCDILHVKSTSVVYTAADGDTASTFAIVLPSVTLTNGQIFELIICDVLPDTSGDDSQVYIRISGTDIPLLLQMGNYVRSNSLRGRTRLVLVYGTDTDHATVLSPCLRN